MASTDELQAATIPSDMTVETSADMAVPDGRWAPSSPVRSPNDQARRAMVRHLSELTTLKQSNGIHSAGNVLVIVNFPETAGQGCDGRRWEDYRCRISHHKLLATGSTKLISLLSERKQAIFRRRHGLNKLPKGVEYVLDLTPLDESDEHANITCALWLPDAARIWWLAGHYEADAILARGPSLNAFIKRPQANKAVGAILSLGHDDVCGNMTCLTDESLWHVQGAHGIYEPGPGDIPIPDFRRIPSYCPVRHRVAIIRLIRAIEGSEILINSAARMWTLSQMAVHLDLSAVVRDQVAQWFMASPNTKFIEIFPEETFKIAYSLQLRDVLLSAFQILVNEAAMELAGPVTWVEMPSPGGKQNINWIKRQRGDYGDYPQDPVEYASRAFHDRIAALVAVLKSDKCLAALGDDMTQWKKLVLLGPLLEAWVESNDPESGTVHPFGSEGPQCTVGFATNPSVLTSRALSRAHANLVEAVTQRLQHAVERAFGHSTSQGHVISLIEAQRRHYLPATDNTPVHNSYYDLNEVQRAMTPLFWDDLLNELEIFNPSSEQQAHFPAGDDKVTWLAATFNNYIRQAQHQSDFGRTLEALCADGTFEFDHMRFQRELIYGIGKIHHKVTYRDNENIQMLLSDHLILKLDEAETKFLPMWAGGLDDGTGGVFQDLVPNAEMGPSEPGPGYHTGYTVASTDNDTDADTLSMAWSGIDSELGRGIGGIDLDDATVARSLDVHGSISSAAVPNRGVVVVPESVASEEFESDMSDYPMVGQASAAASRAESVIAFTDDTGPDQEYDSDDTMSDQSDSTIGASDFDMV